MARILSPVWSIIRGSIAGCTYSANQYHQIIARQKTAPVQPCTPGQTTIKSCFAGAQANWAAQTDSVRQAWKDYALTCFFPGPLGQHTVPGRQIFTAAISLVKYINTRGLDSIVEAFTAPVAPGFLNVTDIASITPALPGTGIAVTWTNQTGEAVEVFAQISVPFQPTRERFKGPWVYSTAKAKDTANNSSGVYEWQGLTSGKVYFIFLRFVSAQAPFRISPIYILRATAQTIV